MPPDFPDPLSKIDFSTPIYTIESLILMTFSMPDCEAQVSLSLYTTILQKLLSRLTNMMKEKEKERKVCNHNAMSFQMLEMNKSSNSGEENKDKFGDLNFPLYDGSKNPHSHLKNYIDKLSLIDQSEGLRMKFFISSLTGLELM